MSHFLTEIARPETKKTLPLALMRCVKIPFIAAVIPRLFLIIFRYSQPIIIKESIKYVVIDPAEVNANRGYWLVVSAVGVYVGLAISTAVYNNCINRLELVTKSTLVGIIHYKTMNSASISYDNGEAATLMSTDAESLAGIGSMAHETWAQVIEVLVGVSLLAAQVGWIWPLPLFLIYLCSHMSRFVATHLQPRQKAWNKATQDRIAATASMLNAMKVVKMLGFQKNLTIRIQELREKELWLASQLRWVMVYYNASANALGIFSPTITLVIFAIVSGARGHNLDTETAFTTMAILSMVTHPANMVMTIVPRAVAAFAGFERIQAFLLRPYPQPDLEILPESPLDSFSTNPKSSQAIETRQLRIGDKHLVLKNVDISMAVGSLTIISGPTGSGKSTLLRAILGEVVPVHGSISISTRRIAYCAQRPWLPSGTMKQVIRGHTGMYTASNQVDEEWYDMITDVCCLTHDLNSLPDGDETQIGSRGLNLSGGQRQRVALARALFARYDIILLDDTFSGLDGETEQIVFDNLFGSTGLLRRLKTTVVLVSNSCKLSCLAY
ncbi:ABC transporter [Phlyctema vagabunda]|uniref:ABC transporter n=1 Tax=Phlyctema vagabunda TaxID=108571 RepID=A0ABR4PYL6_9HELO